MNRVWCIVDEMFTQHRFWSNYFLNRICFVKHVRWGMRSHRSRYNCFASRMYYWIVLSAGHLDCYVNYYEIIFEVNFQTFNHVMIFIERVSTYTLMANHCSVLTLFIDCHWYPMGVSSDFIARLSLLDTSGDFVISMKILLSWKLKVSSKRQKQSFTWASDVHMYTKLRGT